MAMLITSRILFLILVLVLNSPSALAAVETEAGGVIVCFRTMDNPLRGRSAGVHAGDAAFTADSLNRLNSKHRLVECSAMYGAASRHHNTWVFQFPAGADLQAIAGEYAADPSVRYAELNTPVMLASSPIVVTPNDFWYNHTRTCDETTACDMGDSTHSRQWYLTRARWDRAWAAAKGDSSNGIIAIIDSEFDRLHQDLQPRIWRNPREYGGMQNADDDTNGFFDDIWGWDFVGGDNEVYVSNPAAEWPYQHGTQMIGIIGSATNNEPGNGEKPGIAGVSWNNKLLPLRAVGESVQTYVNHCIDAIHYCVEQKLTYGDPITVINCSWVAPWSQSLQDAVADAVDAGILVVGGAGNDGSTIARYPCAFPDVLCMSCVDAHDAKLQGSEPASYGAHVDACGYGSSLDNWTWEGSSVCHEYEYPRLSPECLGLAPYVNPVEWASCGDEVPHVTGWSRMYTSGAAAQASGLAGVLRSLYPDLSPGQTIAMIKRGAISVADSNSGHPWQNLLGAGRIDAYRTLTMWGTAPSDTTLAGKVYVSGSVVVPSGATMTIAAGTELFIAPDDNETTNPSSSRIGIYVESGGELIVNGSEGSPVVFRSWSASDTTGNWEGIHVGSGATLSLSHARVKHATHGVLANEAITLSNCRFDSCVVAVQLDTTGQDTSNLTAVVASHCDKGFFLRQTHADLSGCIADSNKYGFYLESGADVALHDDCEARYNLFDGVYCNAITDLGPDVYATNNGRHGVYVVAAQTGQVMKIDAVASEDNENGGGIRVDYTQRVEVSNCALRRNLRNASAIYGAQLVLGDVTNNRGMNNSITDPVLYDVYTSFGNSVMAENCYWMDCNEEEGGMPYPPHYGSLDWVPYLCQDPQPNKQLGADGLAGSDWVSRNYPNPFNPITRIDYFVSQSGENVSVTVYDVAGRRVRCLVGARQTRGEHEVVWDGRDDGGRLVGAGTYFYSVQIGTQYARTGKMSLLK